MTVTVHDANGDPVEGATVVAVNQATNAVLEATSVADGTATFSGFAGGEVYEVYAVSGSGPSALTAQARLVTAPVSAPVAGTPSVSGDAVTWRWRAVAGQDTYHLEYGTTDGGPYDTAEVTLGPGDYADEGGGVLAYTTPALDPGTYYAVVAVERADVDTYLPAAPMTAGTLVAPNAATWLPIRTFDAAHAAGPEQTTHPSVLYMPGGWGAEPGRAEWWLAHTPYPFGDQTLEDPSVERADSPDGPWTTPAGLTNPVEPFAGEFHSDVCLFDNRARDGHVYLYYREGTSTFYAERSTDGVVWTGRAAVFAPGVSYLSPAVVWDGAQYVMYAVRRSDLDLALVRLTAASPFGPFAGETVCTGALPANAYWHLSVRRWDEGGGAFAFYALSTNQTRVYLGRSTDGLAWTWQTTPAVAQGPDGAWDAGKIYHASMDRVLDAGSGLYVYHVLYSAQSQTTNEWRVGYSKLRKV